MPHHACLEQSNQAGVHELIFIWDIEANDPLALQRTVEPLLELVTMRPLHNYDEVCPLNQFGCQRVAGVVVGSGGHDLNIGSLRENLFRGRAA